jgi:type VI secretion system protein ImpH
MENRTLKEVLFEEPYRFEFFQAVRLLERVFPEKKSVGATALPHEEIARFRSRIALDFPSSEIHEFVETQDVKTGDDRLEAIINFMGMAGVSGVLPTHYTELVLDRVRHRDSSLWSFLDIFTHRAVSMFYRAWAKYRFPVGYESGDDPFTGFLFDFAGLGTHGLRGRSNIDDEALLPYVGLISQKPHSANAVENIIADFFGIKAKIVQFFGQWLPLGPQDVTLLGTQNAALGINSLTGTNVWDQQSKLRIRLGPMTFAQYLAFLPNGSARKAFLSIVKLIAGIEFDHDVQLRLLGRQVPSTILTTRAARRPMLGWTSFLKTKPVAGVDEQLVLSGS